MPMTSWTHSVAVTKTKKTEDFEKFVFEGLAERIFASLKEKIQFRKEIESDGVTYKAWLCWFDERKCLEDEAAFPRCTKDVKFKL